MADNLNAESVLGWVSEPHDGPTISLLAVGDVCPINRVASPLADGQVEDVFGDCLPVLREADVTLVNLELPLCRGEAPIPKCGPNFRGDPRMATALKAAGVNVACLANNHILDQGPGGVAETLAALDAAGIKRVGAGMSASDAAVPLLLEFDEVRLAILNVAEGEFSRAFGGAGAAALDPAANAAAIHDARRRGYVVVVVAHAGSERVPFPSPQVQRTYRQFIDAGAGMVIGHHPHVPQGLEVHHNRPIVYSLGNFVFDWRETEPETDIAFMLQATIAPGGVVGLRSRPVCKSATGGVRRMPADRRPKFLHLLKDLSAPLTDAKRMRRLWEQQCVRLFEPRYAGHLRAVASLATPPAGRPSPEQLAGLGLFNCATHSEAVSTIGRLMLEGRLAPAEPEAGQVAELIERMKALGSQGASGAA